MLRTYKVKHCANKTKINKVIDALKEYRTAAEKIAGSGIFFLPKAILIKIPALKVSIQHYPNATNKPASIK
ncbi:MAG: hypothetical protein K9L56_13990 [Clostridiales bacterium]|nr:hypothetical protein [Clostridiales bacterium]